MNNSMINSIKSLPPLPKSIVDMQRVCNDPEASLRDLINVVKTDPMIVANLLKAANSPLYSFKREILGVDQAVSLFGMSMTRSIALGNAVRKLLNVDMEPYGISADYLADVSTLQGTLAREWYLSIDKQKADKLFLAAFLQETGKIVLASEIIKEDQTDSFKYDIEFAPDISAIERSYVGETTASVAAAVFEHWNFEKEFIDMIAHSDNPANAPEDIRELSMALHIIKTIVPVNNPFGEHPIAYGLKKAAEVGYDATILESAIDKVIDSIED